MDNYERVDFDKQLTTMLSGFPGYFITPERLEAYWRGLQKMQMSSLIRVVDFVLSEDGPEKIPGVSALWTIYRKLKTVRADNREPVDTGMTREQHLTHLRRLAINAAREETMPRHLGAISRDAPLHRQKKNDEDWAQWDATLGQKDDAHWLARAEQLMLVWGEKDPKQFDASNALRGFL